MFGTISRHRENEEGLHESPDLFRVVLCTDHVDYIDFLIIFEMIKLNLGCISPFNT